MKKLLKKSIACLIAVLMVVSVMPLTTPISAEAANEQFAAAKSALNSWTQETFTITPTHETTSSAGTNIVYASGTTNWTSNAAGSNAYAGVGRINVKFATPNVIVGVYDGTTKPEYPIVMETVGNAKAQSHRINRAYINSTTSLSLKQRWKGYGTNYQQWPGSKTSREFGYLTNDKNGSDGTESKDEKHFWWNMMVYNGTGNTTNYYDKDTNFSFYVATAYQERLFGSFTEATNTVYMKGDVYTINYSALINKINEAKTKVNNIDNSKTYCTKLVNDFTSAVNQLTSIKVSSYFSGKQDSQISQAVTDCTQAISNAISAYNTASANLGEHNYQKDEITYKAPTCTVDGKEADEFCVYCNDIIKGATIPATGHNLTQTVAKDATCTEAGNSAYWTCSTCKKMFSDANAATEINAVPTISATGHKNGEPVRENVQDSTCTATGSYDEVVYCSVCRAEISRTEKTIDKKAHDYKSTVTAPTCTEKGYTTYTCSACNDTYKDNYTNALGHNMQVVDGTAKDATCTEAGKEADKKCSRCNYTEPGATIDAKGHIEEVIPAVEATCTTAGSTAGTKCSVCDVIIVAPETIPAKGHSYKYTYNNNSTHTKACENCDESSIEDCTNELKEPGTTSDTWHCKVCLNEYHRTVSEKGTLIAAIDALKNDVNADDAEYRYTSEAINKANGVIESAQLVLNDRYADQKTVVDAMVSKVASEKTDLNSNGLAKYTVTFEVVNDDNGETVARDVNPDVTYGTVLDFNENLLVDKDGNSLVVYKWKKRDANNNDTVLNSTSKDFSVVVKENATYFCYVLNSKASDETNTKTRVRYIDKSGKTIKIDFATVGDSYTVDNNVKAPKIPYYKFTEWNLIYGDDVSVGTRELVYQAQYEYDEVEANNCTIIGLNGVYVNGSNQCTSRYDDKVMLTGADETDKYAFCDSTGNTIISYINNDYIHTPHLNGTVVYITKVKVPTTDATTAVTGYFTQPGTPFNTLYVNAQYYLPEGATTVEAGIVISRLQTTTDTLQIGNAGVAKVESNSQGSNHEYSIGMTYSASATYYSRSYLIYKLADGTTKTVYSNDVTIINV